MKIKSTMILAGLLALSISMPLLAQVPQPGDDRRHQIRIGIEKIDGALNHLQTAGDEWGGHRAAAMKDLAAAKQELEAALQTENQMMGK